VGGGYLNPSKDLGDAKGAIMTGVGAGVRFLTWTLGARFRFTAIPDATMWTLGGEAGFHLPTGRWDPYVNLHAGYAQLTASNAPADFPSTHGLDLGLSVGSDYYVTSFLSFGLDVTGDLLFLKRAEYAPVLQPPVASAVRFPEASGTGFAIIGSVHGGVHFDL